MREDEWDESPEITRLISQSADGVDGAHEQLFAIVYDELHALAARKLRGERADFSLSPTDLVSEAYLRLVKQRSSRWRDRTHFFKVAARIIRRVLVDHARARNAQKRGGGAARRSMTTLVDGRSLHTRLARLDVLALEEALDALVRESPPRAQVVELRFFAGLSVAETAAVMDVHEMTVKRYWKFSQAWLFARMSEGATEA